ncbi:hypothetical protein ACJIZ3_011161 [Penstemon smallii]|uniref:Uncharacterized protein n=1 Tax=Penstemon smallii TaxID=265156 RepID=A0ABD3UID1_9LAMI
MESEATVVDKLKGLGKSMLNLNHCNPINKRSKEDLQFEMILHFRFLLKVIESF